jgi:sterol desaturase/sphingolipid hydroxylase (fatty acid hydroxylase superfamily)
LTASLLAIGTVTLGLDPLGVFAYQALIGFHQPLHHSNLDWRLPRWLTGALGWIFVRPSQHALHHSALEAETNSNFGQLFSIWDRLAGTLREADEAHLRALSIGLGAGYDRVASRIGSQLTLPFAPLEGPGTSGDPVHLLKGNTRQ